jgi:uncharacterized protein (DUF4415 family)
MERKRTKSEERRYLEMILGLIQLEAEVKYDRLKRSAIPKEWYEIHKKVPVRPRKTRVTAAYDADLVKWFRSLGHGYQARMNAVLRAYMLAVVSKEITGPGDYDWKGDPI